MRSRSRNAAPKAIAGAAKAGMTTLCAIPCQSTPFEPDWTSAAPTRPPISACDELDGSPNHQVRRFQAIAPASAARTVCSVARPASMIPFPTVFEPAELDELPPRLLEAGEALDRLLKRPRGAQDDVARGASGLADLRDAIA